MERLTDQETEGWENMLAQKLASPRRMRGMTVHH
jgi:hypothetical protein